jgi:hypothetical protein
MPDVALRLESEQLREELSRLGIRFIYRRTKRSSCFEIDMTPDHVLRIEPVDRGVNQYAEWFSWHTEERDGQPLVKASIRCYASIRSGQSRNEVGYALTIHSETIVDLIQCAIYSYKLFSGTEISPKSSNRKNNR